MGIEPDILDYKLEDDLISFLVFEQTINSEKQVPRLEIKILIERSGFRSYMPNFMIVRAQTLKITCHRQAM